MTTADQDDTTATTPSQRDGGQDSGFDRTPPQDMAAEWKRPPW